MNFDNNTEFFHTEVQIKRQRNYIFSIRTSEGITFANPEQIMTVGVSFFKQL